MYLLLRARQIGVRMCDDASMIVARICHLHEIEMCAMNVQWMSVTGTRRTAFAHIVDDQLDG